MKIIYLKHIFRYTIWINLKKSINNKIIKINIKSVKINKL